MIEKERTKNWSFFKDKKQRTIDDETEFPYVVRREGEVIGRVRAEIDALTICATRSGRLREAGNRAADLRRYKMQQDQMALDIRAMMQTLDNTAQVLKQSRPRDVLRAREEIHKILARMKGRGYVK